MRAAIGTPLQEKFERYYIPEPNTGCWLWMGALSAAGYGQIRDTCKRLTLYAHRVSYEMYVGPVGDLRVLHHCDNPPCVNPVHLFLGTQADNVADMVRKGRCIKSAAGLPYGVRKSGDRFGTQFKLNLKSYSFGTYATAEVAAQAVAEGRERVRREAAINP